MKYSLSILLTIITLTALTAQVESSKEMKKITYPYDVKECIINDSTTIAYIDEGKSDTTLLFIHGLGTYLKAFSTNVDSLSKTYRCIALDLPGYGKSSINKYSFTQSFFTKTILDFIDSLELSNVVLVGHSMGGQIATHIASKKPSNIIKMVLISPAGFEKFSEKDVSWFKSVTTPQFYKSLSEEQIVKNHKMNFYNFPESAQFLIDDRMKLKNHGNYEAYCEMIPRCVIGMLEEPTFSLLSEIEIPVMVIYGKNDMLIPNQYLHPNLSTEEVAKNGIAELPNAQLHIIKKAGHFVSWEKANKVNSLIKSFVR